MPKKEHIHIVTDSEHKENLENLGKTHGSMTKAFEFAIDRMGIDAASACKECKIKLESEVTNKFREILNVISFTGEDIQDLNDYFRGDIPVRELLTRARQKAFELGRKYHGFFNILPDNTYENLLTSLEEYKQRTRLLKALEVDKFSKKIVARVNDAFKSLPILVTMGLIGFLESYNFTFDIDLFQADIILSWINPEIFAMERGRIEEKILTYMENADQSIKPYLFKKGLVLITPELLDWFIEKLFGHYMVPSEISYTLANLVVGDIKMKEDPGEISNLCVDTVRDMNMADQITREIIDAKSFRLSVSCVKPNICSLTLNGLTQVLAKYGWKLKPQKKQIDGRTLRVVYHYVGDDPSILDPLYINNFIAYQNQHFETLRVVSVDEFDDIATALYERDPEAFREIFRKQGMKIGNAVRQLARTPDQIPMVAFQVIPQLVRSLKSPEDVSFFPEKSGFTIILKKLDILTLERLRALITGSLESFGYSNVKSKILGNQVSWEFVRPFEIEEKVPKIETAP